MLANGESYEGQFIEGQKHGRGVYKWANGDIYSGLFYQDKRSGLGTYQWQEGGYYRGDWGSDRMDGLGLLVKDEIEVMGEFFADQFVRAVREEDMGEDKLRFIKSR